MIDCRFLVTANSPVCAHVRYSCVVTTGQVNELNACWINVICTLFGYNRWQSISALLLLLERLTVRHLIISPPGKLRSKNPKVALNLYQKLRKKIRKVAPKLRAILHILSI